MSTTGTQKPRLTTSAMIASIASEGQRTTSAPFGHALAAEANRRTDIVGMTADLSKYTDTYSPPLIQTATSRWAWPSSC